MKEDPLLCRQDWHGRLEVIPSRTKWTDWAKAEPTEWVQVYEQLYCMSQLEALKGIDTYIIEFLKKFKKIFVAKKAHEEKMPGELEDKLKIFQKMLLLKAIRADKVSSAI